MIVCLLLYLCSNTNNKYFQLWQKSTLKTHSKCNRCYEMADASKESLSSQLSYS